MAETYISVDVEASGPLPPKYSMLSVGACVVGAVERSFYAELHPISLAFVPKALEVVGRPLEHFTLRGRPPAEVMKAFAHWIAEASGTGDPVFVGFNATFDWAFVNWYFLTYLSENPFGIGGVDIKSFYMGRTRSTWADARSSRLPERFKNGAPETHNALDDARRQAELFLRISEDG